MAPPRKYLQVDEFENFRDNHFAHIASDVRGLKKDVRWLQWVVGLGLGGTIALLATTLGFVIAST